MLKEHSARCLKLSSDRKVSPLSVWERAAKRFKPVVFNSFGLPAGEEFSCPGETAFCAGCYAERTEKIYPGAGRLVHWNFDLLSGASVPEMVELLDELVETWLIQVDKVERRTNRDIERWFRIHWDGDIFSLEYALAWARVVRSHPTCQFWLYTRSFALIGPFAGIPNITVYLSVDEENVSQALAAKAEYPWVKLAFCGRTWDDTEVVASKFEGERKGPRCPELTGKIPMVNDQGIGACVACKLCVFGVNNVRFAIKH